MKDTGDEMENFEVIIIGDGREAVVCAHAASKKYPGKNVLILISDYECFLNKINSLFYYKLERNNQPNSKLLLNGSSIYVTADEALDRKGHKLYLRSGRIISFEKLILAQGCKCPSLSIEGQNKEGIYFLKSCFDHLAEIKRSALCSDHIVIYGGSYIGVKLADELIRYNKNVTIIEKSAWLLPHTIDLTLGREVMELLSGQGCRVMLNRKIKKIKGDKKISSIELSNSENIDCDILLVSCRNKPEIRFAQKLGLICDRDRGILVDEYCRTSEKDIFAVGECAAHFEFFKGDLAEAILSSTYELESTIVGANLYSVIYNRNSLLEILYSLNTVS